MLTSGQTAHHEATHDGLDQSLPGLPQPLVVFAKLAALYQPAKGPFHYPAAGSTPRKPRGRSASQSMTAPMGAQTPLGLGGCCTTSTLQPRGASIHVRPVPV
jgi:hypothetical protein